MAARSPAFRQADVARAYKGATSAGMAVGRVEIDSSGKIVLIPAGQKQAEPEAAVDKWIADHARAT